MRVLGVESATDVASVALVDSSGLVAERTVRRPMRSLEWLGPAILGMLEDLKLGPDAVEGVAVSVGPGSFTGLRVGIATAVGWARARGVPACGVATLEALAATVEAPVVAAVTDARRGEVAGALFVREDGVLTRAGEDVVGPPEAVAEEFLRSGKDPRGWVVVGDALARYGDLLARRLPGARFAQRVLWCPRAAAVAWLGRERLLAGGGEPLWAIQPRYGRTPAFREVGRP